MSFSETITQFITHNSPQMNITRLMRTNRSVNYLAVDILDRFFMNNSNVSKGDLVFLGVTCILVNELC